MNIEEITVELLKLPRKERHEFDTGDRLVYVTNLLNGGTLKPKYVFTKRDDNSLVSSVSTWAYDPSTPYDKNARFVDVDDIVKRFDKDDLRKMFHPSCVNDILRYKGESEEQKYRIDGSTLVSSVGYNIAAVGEYKVIKPVINNVVNKNTEASKVAAKITAGRTLNSLAINKISPILPTAVRAYVDSPAANIVVANAVSFAVNHFLKGNAKAEWAADAMMQAAMVELFDSFDIDKLLSSVLGDINV